MKMPQGFSYLKWTVDDIRWVTSFYHIWAWWPSWPCDPDSMNKPTALYSLRKLVWFNQPSNFKADKNNESLDLGIQDSEWLWPLVFIKVHLADCIYQQRCHRRQQNQKKKYHFVFFPYKCWSDLTWPWHKTGQDQPKVIIWTNLVGPETLTQHTDFHGHMLVHFRTEELPCIGKTAILVLMQIPHAN